MTLWLGQSRPDIPFLATAPHDPQRCNSAGRCWKGAAFANAAIIMRQAILSSDIRQLVNHTFAELHLSAGCDPRETVLIRDGLYCGRRFDVENGHAVWFMEEEQIKFFRADGRLARVIEPIAASTVRLAAPTVNR